MRNLISISALAAKYKRENKTLSTGPKLEKKKKYSKYLYGINSNVFNYKLKNSAKF